MLGLITSSNLIQIYFLLWQMLQKAFVKNRVMIGNDNGNDNRKQQTVMITVTKIIMERK